MKVKILFQVFAIFAFMIFSNVTYGLSDINSHRYQSSIQNLIDQKIIKGYPDGTFRPDDEINRAELSKILVLAYTVLPDQKDDLKNCFIDVSDRWYAQYVCMAKQKGWVWGYQDGSFRPSRSISRAEAVKLIVESASFEDIASTQDFFSDVSQKDWFFTYVSSALAKNLLPSKAGSLFNPHEKITRGEVAEIISRALAQKTSESSDRKEGSIDMNKEKLEGQSEKSSESSSKSTDSASTVQKSGGRTVGGGGSVSTGSSGGSSSTNSPVSPPNNVPSVLPNFLVWANEGGDKIIQSELRGKNDPSSTISSVWDGSAISIFGAKNEVVNFNLIIEAPDQEIKDVEITLNSLVGPQGYVIKNQGNDLFNWAERNIEAFYIKYLPIKGVSIFMSENYDQRHLPKDLRAPHDAQGIPTGKWEDRKNHDQFYPEIAVPLELEQNFTLKKGENQSIWFDIYIPKNSLPGDYLGEIEIKDSLSSKKVPLRLEVLDFTLPDEPSAKTMLVFSEENINNRYLGEKYPNDLSLIQKSNQIIDRHFQMAHRHKVSLIGYGDHATEDRPNDQWIRRLSGEVFTPKNGYSGPGEGLGTNVYSIGLYGGWSWDRNNKAEVQARSNAWEKWFKDNFPKVDRFLYLIDESKDFAQTEKWAKWILDANPGGSTLPTMATIFLEDAKNYVPSLTIPTATIMVAPKNTQDVVDAYLADPNKKIYLYNGGRPGQGSFMTDDDGVALRQMVWAQVKKKIDRWFYWESTYYNNFQAGRGETSLFQNAHTFGGHDRKDSLLGETGWNYSNGDGVLFYPGKDMVYPQDSYNVEGPIASLRLKYWRRGIQDADYIELAKKANAVKADQLIQKMVPKVLWEYGVADPNDPSWVRTEISWSDQAEDWESARRELAEIILNP